MPYRFTDLAEFARIVSISRNKVCYIKRDGAVFKFKLRGPTQKTTLIVHDASKARSVRRSIPREWKIVDVALHKKKGGKK
ncbi:putative 60s ribosomal L38 [Monocercomonoides exilis]|uniref:putative 60s ribosomal L38 n=1 Tax=Monocercomonoides exilis TaxID=2049356 RepID=UPI0035593F88|nr:putative 60s ribosomal L38 [Monocercomonoides exilis]|eukprot:MONOS_2849.1-p1 / transcript=MONOS_2849.1 / gene=MONOS_2849 / organism=Monocercomonoides_exilis_PA203 / gene_product=60s ribosomal L38 / transcript_product=60s ribosomal L38 / location=Mono_scaffold00061:146008-146519(-) / protein_length=80 / sequence_SO=supercontig / SO=protein_coding / is_pseudo=false